jgi:hypothetical protein
MELIVLTTVLTLANIGGVTAMTESMPEYANREPVPYESKTVVAAAEPKPNTLIAAIIDYKKRLGLI